MTEEERGYEIYASDDGGLTYDLLFTLADSTQTAYTDAKLPIGGVRRYRMRSYVYGDGKKVFSPYTSVGVVTSKPRTATGLTLSSTASNEITLSWTGSAAPTKYLVYRSTNATTTA